MPDTTLCNGEGCPFKTECLRFTAPPSEHQQSYFVELPYDSKKDHCDFYIYNGNEIIEPVREEQEEEEEDFLCSTCNGSGEGMYDGSTCWNCHGTGTEPSKNKDYDY